MGSPGQGQGGGQGSEGGTGTGEGARGPQGVCVGGGGGFDSRRACLEQEDHERVGAVEGRQVEEEAVDDAQVWGDDFGQGV